MNTLVRIFFVVVAVCLLASSYFADLVLSSRIEMMTWEEFSKNPEAVAKFRSRVETAVGTTEIDLQTAFEHYVEKINAAEPSPTSTKMSTAVSGMKSRWTRFYDVLTPSPNRMRTAPLWARRFFHDYGDSFGEGFALLTLLAGLIGMVRLLRLVEGKAQL